MEKLKQLGLDDEFGAYYDAEIVHRKEINSARSDGYSDGKQDGRKEGKKEGRKEGKIEGKKYNVPIDVDINRRRYPLKWTYQEGMKSSIIDTKIWVF